jgi:hypothetical protein
MLSVKKMAEKYYPEYWNKDRLRSLVQVGKLTEEEYHEITGEKY